MLNYLKPRILCRRDLYTEIISYRRCVIKQYKRECVWSSSLQRLEEIQAALGSAL